MNIQPIEIDRMMSNAAAASRLMKALSNPHRLIVLCHLNHGECSVGDLQASVGISQSALSQHLARLREDGLVATRRQAQTIYYRLADDAVREVIGLLYRLYCEPGPNTKKRPRDT